MDCAYTPTTPNSKSKFTFDFDEKRLQTEVEMLEEKKEAAAAVKQVETELCHYATPEKPTLESSQSSSSDFFTPMANPPTPKIYVTSPFASPLQSGLKPGRTKLHFSSLRQEKILKKLILRL